MPDQEPIIDVMSYRAEIFSKTLTKVWRILNSQKRSAAIERLSIMRAAAKGDASAQAVMAADDHDSYLL